MLGRTNATVGSNKFPTGISITTVPNKTAYTAGETLDMAGIVVTATYSDNSTVDITSECAFSPSDGSVVYENTEQVTVTWIWKNAVTYTATQAITVTRVLSSISVTAPTKTSYYKGDTLDLSGMVVTATYNSGASEAATGYSTSPANGSTLSSLGTVTVTASYTENGVTKTASFTVTVSVKIVTWAAGTDAEIVAMVEAADAGIITLSDYWAVGDERSVSLSAMAATGVGESHAAQTVTMVLMNQGGKTLVEATESGRTECSFIVGLKNCLTETGYMNSSDTNSGSWNSSARRTWCNSIFRNAIPSTLREIFKQHKNLTIAAYNGSSNQETADYFALPAEKEIFGSATYSNSVEANALSQFTYYATASNRVKKLGNSGSASVWWERSPYSGGSSYFCRVYSGGSAYNSYASIAYGIAPFGCI